MKEPPKPSQSWFEHFFLRHGAGSHFFKPVSAWRHFNVVAWIAIVLGMIGWALFAWFLRVHFPED